MICLEHARRHIHEELSDPAQEVGQIWGHPDFGIDVAGRLLNWTYFYGECKWRSAPIAKDAVMKLKERAEATTYGKGSPGKQFVFFSRLGFRQDVIDLAKTDASVHPIRLERLVAAPDPALDDTDKVDDSVRPTR